MSAPAKRIDRLASQLRASQTSAQQQPQSIRMGPDGELLVPDFPIIPFIEGDGTGPDIWNASVRVLDAAVAKAYGGNKKIAWLEVLAGEKAFRATGNWLPEETIQMYREHLVGIKGEELF
jgi:isocitrate dehydrogenase